MWAICKKQNEWIVVYQMWHTVRSMGWGILLKILITHITVISCCKDNNFDEWNTSLSAKLQHFLKEIPGSLMMKWLIFSNTKSWISQFKMDRCESTILSFHNEELGSKKPKRTKTEIGFLTCTVIFLSVLFGSIIFLIISGKHQFTNSFCIRPKRSSNITN